MPLALTIAGVGLPLVSAGLSMAGNAVAQKQMNATRAQAVAKNASLARESNAVFKTSLSKSGADTAAQQVDAGAAQRGTIWNALQQASQPVASALPATASNAKTVQGSSGADAWNKLTSKAQAKEGGYSDWQTQQAVKNAEADRQQSMINNFARADASLLPTELQVASAAGDKLGAWGSIVGSLGTLAGMTSSFGTPTKTGTGVSPTQSQAAANEFNGNGAPGMAGGPQVLPATNTAWNKIYSGTA